MLDEAMGYAPPRELHAAITAATDAARVAVGEAALAAAWEAGGARSLKQAVAEALAMAAPVVKVGAVLALTRHETSENAPSLAHLGLTPREREVLQMMASGRSNQDIADALFVSVGTVKVHITHVLAKLGVKSRSAATDYAHRHGLA